MIIELIHWKSIIVFISWSYIKAVVKKSTWGRRLKPLKLEGAKNCDCKGAQGHDSYHTIDFRSHWIVHILYGFHWSVCAGTVGMHHLVFVIKEVLDRAPPEETKPFWRSHKLRLLYFLLKNDSYETFGLTPLENPEAEPGRNATKGPKWIACRITIVPSRWDHVSSYGMARQGHAQFVHFHLSLSVWQTEGEDRKNKNTINEARGTSPVVLSISMSTVFTAARNPSSRFQLWLMRLPAPASSTKWGFVRF
jgi:hypothetical protein